MKKLQNLLEDEVKQLFAAEKLQLKAMPEMINSAKNPILREAFQSHYEETRSQFERIQEICFILNVHCDEFECDPMKRLIDNFCLMSELDASSKVKDAGLLSCTKRIEHFEIAGYSNSLGYARTLGKTNIANLLNATLSEEHSTNERLTLLADSSINLRALSIL